MFRNIPSRTLIFIFGFFLILAIIMIYYDSSHEERTFEKNIVNIDTSKVTAISIFPKVTNHKEVKLFKEGNYWKVRLDNNKSVPAEFSKVKNLLNQLVQIKSNSVAAQEENKWGEFKVDSSGTRVQVHEGNSTTLDIIIGKFTFQQPKTALSYVRLKGDKIVYEVVGFLEFSFNQKANDFRNSILISDDLNNWKRLTFTYPSDSSFQIIKDSSGYWTINGVNTDSIKTIEVLRNLSHLSSSSFLDDFDQSIFRKANYTLTIESSALGVITLTASADANQFIIRSSQNPAGYFDGKANSLWQQIYKAKSDFLKKR
jgi:hypothetical protein